MGSQQLRKIIRKMQRFTDKSAPRHKHNYSIHAIARVRTKRNDLHYYEVMKCKYCSSFEAISHQGAPNGLILFNELHHIDKSLPVINLTTNHDFIDNFSSVELE